MVGASPEFCLPCTSCGDTFDSLRLLRKHKCGFTQNTTADIKLGNVPENKTPTIVDKIKVETMIDLQKGSCLDPIQICEATLETIDNKNVIATTNNKKKSRKLKCNHCETEFLQYRSYDRHMLRHREETTYTQTHE